jgi:hypothetical protein
MARHLASKSRPREDLDTGLCSGLPDSSGSGGFYDFLGLQTRDIGKFTKIAVVTGDGRRTEGGDGGCGMNHKKQSQSPRVLKTVLRAFVLSLFSALFSRYLALQRPNPDICKCILTSKKPSQRMPNRAYRNNGAANGTRTTSDLKTEKPERQGFGVDF